MKWPEEPQPPRAFFIFRQCRYVLEVKLQAKLDQARPAVRDYLSERGTEISTIVYAQELDMVEGVEEFGAKFKRLALRDIGSLGEREIPIVDSRTPQIIAGQVSVGKERNAGVAKGIGARIRVGTGAANEVGRIEPEISGFRARTSSIAVGAEGLLRISGLVSERDRTDDVGTIQIVVLLTGIGIGVKVDRLTALKRHDAIDLPSFGNLCEQAAVRMARERQLVNAADNKALRNIKVGDGAVEARIVGIRVSGGAGAESGSKVNRLRPSIGSAERNAMREALVQSDLQLIAVR